MIMDIFTFAMKMEKDGEDFYRDLVSKSKSKGLKNIFSMLADDEVNHYNVLKQMKDRVTPGKTILETRVLSNAKNVFQQIKGEETDFDFSVPEKELYKKALEIEERSAAFYKEKAKEVEDQVIRELLLEFEDEEKKHIFLLENIIEFVTRPEHWLETAEFNHLEDY
jgi:hypothetical protein